MNRDLYLTRWKRFVDVEDLLADQLRRVAIFRSQDRAKYASAVDMFVMMTPLKLRQAALDFKERLKLHGCNYKAIDDETLMKYDELLMYTLHLLENENLIYRKRELWKWGAEGAEPEKIS